MYDGLDIRGRTVSKGSGRILIVGVLFLAVALFSIGLIVSCVSEDSSASTTFTVDGFSYEASGTTATIVSYSGDETTISIPETVTYSEVVYTVTAIKSQAFIASNIQRVIDTGNVTSIGDYAFMNSTDLRSITFGDEVVSLGVSAFYGCSALSTVTLNTGLTAIYTKTFQSCRSLTEITIPNTVQSIVIDAFGGCTSLSKIIVSPGGSYYSSHETSPGVYDGILYNGNTTQIVLCPEGMKGSVNIISTVTSIGSGAFSDCYNVTTVSFATSQDITINARAFEGCTNLTAINAYNNLVSLGQYAFKDCTSLQSFNFIKLTEVPNHAFEGCTSLSTISFNNSALTKIGDYAFSGCSSLRYLTTITGLQTIGNYAFQGCSDMTSANISNSVTSLGDGAFSGCSAMSALSMPDCLTLQSKTFEKCTALSTVTITRGNNNPVDYTEYTYKYTPWYVSSHADHDDDYKITISFSSGITKIGNNMFRECTYLTEIQNLSYTHVVTIGNYAFYGCTRLMTNPSFPQSTLTTIGEYAFYGCTEIVGNIKITSNVTTIGNAAFGACSKVTGFTLSGNTYFTEVDGILFSRDGKKLIQCYASYEGPYTIPDTVTEIGSGAFAGCTNMTGTLMIPANVSVIGSYAFDGCSGLTGMLTIPSTVVSIGSYAFSNCTGLTGSLTIPSTVVSIGSYAFNKCTHLTGTINIPQNMTAIPEGLFAYCFSFSSLYIHNNVTSIGKNAFIGCTGLSGTLSLSDNMTSIGDSAFYDCSSFTSITLPITLEIQRNTFYNCVGLTSVTLTPGSTGVGVQYTSSTYTYTPWYISSHSEYVENRISLTLSEGIIQIGDYTFYSCSNGNAGLAGKVELPSSLVSIGKNAFNDCHHITEIVIRDNVTSIGDMALVSCWELTSITVSSGNQKYSSLNGILFNKYMDALIVCPGGYTGEFTIPSTITTLYSYAFQGCVNLTSVVIPDTLIQLPDHCFDSCSSLTKLSMPIDISFSNSSFTACNAISEVILTGGQTGQGPNWLNVSQRQYLPWYISDQEISLKVCSGVTYIGTGTFQNCRLISVELPVGCTTLGTYAFSGCTSMRTLTIPVDLNFPTSGNGAFTSCSGLIELTLIGDTGSGTSGFDYTTKSLTYTPWYLSRANSIALHINEGVKTIGTYMFYNCTGICDYELPSSLEMIGTYAFYGTNGSRQVVIGSALSSIGEMAFSCSPYIESFVVVEGNEYFSSDNGVLYRGQTEELIQCPTGFIGEYTIASSATKIDGYAFYQCTNLTGVVIPIGITTLSPYSFYQCGSMTHISLPASLGITANNIFEGCTAITQVTITDSPDHTTYRYDYTTLQYTPWYKSSHAGSQIDVVVCEGVTSVEAYMFCSCTGLKSVVLPDSLVSVDTTAFSNDTEIERLTMPITVSYSSVFPSNMVTEIHLTKGTSCAGFNYTSTSYSTLPWARNQSSAVTIELESGITSIGSYGFTGSKQIREIIIPDSVTTIGEYAFYNCSMLEHVTMPAELVSMGSHTFSNCVSITEVVVKGPITAIPEYAFSNCTGLNSLSFESSTTSFGQYALYNCSALTKLVIPKTVQDSTDIGQGAFSGCMNLADLTIPFGLSINSSIFSGCTKVTHVLFTYTGDSPTYSTDTVVYTPWYLNRDATNGVTIEFEKGTGVSFEFIPECMFYGCIGVVSVALPSTIETVYGSAFRYSGIREITIPDSTTLLGDYAFADCASLVTVIVGENVTSTGIGTFSNCTAMSYLQIPASMPMSENLYQNCRSVITVVITPGVNDGQTYAYSNTDYDDTPWYMCTYDELTIILKSGVKKINGYMFHGCTRITKISFYDNAIDFEGHWVNFAYIRFLDENENELSLNTANMAECSFEGSRGGDGYANLVRSRIIQATGVTIDEDPTKTVKETKSSLSRYFTITATVQPENATNKEFVWSTSDANVVDIDQDGVATIVGPGTATLRVTTVDGGYFTECVVTVIHNLVPVSYKAPNCGTGTDGNIAHYRCSCCNARFQDAEGEIPITSWVIKATHDMEEIAAKEATCREAGNEQCYHCKTCGKYFSDAAGTMEISFPVIEKLDHDMTYYEGYDSQGVLPGMVSHYHCSLCNGDYSDSIGTVEYSNLNTYDVAVLVNNTEYGSVSLSLLKNVLHGSEVTQISGDLMIGDTRIIATPTETTAQYAYKFSYWSIPADSIVSYTEYIAVFTREIRSYNIIFYSADNETPYQSDVIEYGKPLNEPNTPPSKEDSTMYTYSFSKWVDKNKQEYVPGTVVTGDAEYYPTYDYDLRTFRITFLNEDTVYEQYYLKYGEVIEAPDEDPTKPQTSSIVYVFIGWSNFTSGMIADFSYTFSAEYREDTRYYTATFMSDDNVFVVFDDLEYESEIPDPGTPTKEQTETYQYEFSSWDYYAKGVKITEDVTYNALYTKLLYAYTVDETGKVYVDSTDVTSFNIARDTVIKLKKDAMNNNVNTLEIVFSNGSVKLDTDSILSLTNTKQKVTFDILEYDRMPSAMKNVVKERTVFNINIGTVHQFAGTLTITINYEPSPREDTRNLVIWYVTTSGTYQEIACTYSNYQVTFETNHLSYYSVILSSPAPDAEYWPKIAMVLVGAAVIFLGVLAVTIVRRNAF